MKLSELKQDVMRQLSDAGIDDPLRETNYVLAFALDADRLSLLNDRELSDAEENAVLQVAQRRANREPLDRIRGAREFHSLDFSMNSATLAPRDDTEALVDLAFIYACTVDAPYILDLGTGTGCILLSLLHDLPNAKGVGVDISAEAAEQARQNAQALKIDNAVFIQSDWFRNVQGRFDVIVSNPPYIPTSEIPTLDDEVKNHDPVVALDGGADGLDPYRTIFRDARRFLKKDGVVVVEFGQGQGRQIMEIAAAEGFAKMAEKFDLSGILRAIAFQ